MDRIESLWNRDDTAGRRNGILGIASLVNKRKYVVPNLKVIDSFAQRLDAADNLAARYGGKHRGDGIIIAIAPYRIGIVHPCGLNAN